MTKVLSIIIPLYNEEKTIGQLLEKVAAAPLPEGLRMQWIIVDDASQDSTVAIVEEYMLLHAEQDMVLLRQEKNKGKGGALHRGIAHATGDYVLIQDGDLEYEPGEYARLLAPVLSGDADVVYGSRFTRENPHRALSFWHAMGNKILTFLTNAVTDLHLTDMETCYKLFKRELLQSLHLREQRFGFEPEVTIKASRYPQVRIYEVGISYYGRSYGEGKKIGWKDGVRAIYCILRYGLLRIR